MHKQSKLMFTLLLVILLIVPSTAVFANPEGSKAKSDGHSNPETHATTYKSKHHEKKTSSYGEMHSSYKKMKDKWGQPFSWILKNKEEIGLTKEQEDMLLNHKFTFEKDNILVKAELEIAKLDLMQELHGDELDEMKVRSAAKRLSETKAKKINGWVEAKINLRKVLTKEQKTKAKKLYSSHH